jgi:hypothetical protein
MLHFFLIMGADADARDMNGKTALGTQLTCFTGTKVQILTQKALLDLCDDPDAYADVCLRMLTYADVC